jgi:hypothetical protein
MIHLLHCAATVVTAGSYTLWNVTRCGRYHWSDFSHQDIASIFRIETKTSHNQEKSQKLSSCSADY